MWKKKKILNGKNTQKNSTRDINDPDNHDGNDKKCSNYCTIALISHDSKVMLKTLQVSLQQCMNQELSDVQARFRKGRGTRDQTANICWIIEKAREYQKKKICFTDYTKAFDCIDHNKLWKILKEMEIPDHLTWLLRNLYAGQEATVRTRHGTMVCSKLGKEYVKAVYRHPADLNYMQSTSCEMPHWMKHKLESILSGETSITSDMQMTPPL